MQTPNTSKCTQKPLLAHVALALLHGKFTFGVCKDQMQVNVHEKLYLPQSSKKWPLQCYAFPDVPNESLNCASAKFPSDELVSNFIPLLLKDENNWVHVHVKVNKRLQQTDMKHDLLHKKCFFFTWSNSVRKAWPCTPLGTHSSQLCQICSCLLNLLIDVCKGHLDLGHYWKKLIILS